jgi:CheY-like chemotaxis protein
MFLLTRVERARLGLAVTLTVNHPGMICLSVVGALWPVQRALAADSDISSRLSRSLEGECIVHVLVVDDDRAIRETLRLALEDEGYAVFEAADGLAALELLHAHVVPMVVLLDLRMPRLDGVEVLREVAGSAELSGRNAYALVTANRHTLDTSSDRLLTHLAAPVIAKPFDLDDLLETVERLACRLARRSPDFPPSTRATL